MFSLSPCQAQRQGSWASFFFTYLPNPGFAKGHVLYSCLSEANICTFGYGSCQVQT